MTSFIVFSILIIAIESYVIYFQHNAIKDSKVLLSNYLWLKEINNLNIKIIFFSNEIKRLIKNGEDEKAKTYQDLIDGFYEEVHEKEAKIKRNENYLRFKGRL